MRCDQFDDRLNKLLDLRENPADDPQLARHVRVCAECESVLEGWLRIEHACDSGSESPIAPPPGAVASLDGRPWSQMAVGITLAASLLGCLWYAGGEREQETQIVATTEPVAPLDFDEIGSRVAQPEWWGSVVRAAWEPVDPLAEGFRPLTNSLQTAFELLTPVPQTSTAVPPTLPEDANVGLPNAPLSLV